jgi:peptidoglycan/xylan/chitin deacetylase (PgdA/CDA1 family)
MSLSPERVRLLLIAVLLLAWETVPRRGLMPTLFQPPFTETMAALGRSAPEYLRHLLLSAKAILIAGSMACGAGILLGRPAGAIRPVLASLRVGGSLVIVGVIVAEMLTSAEGVGYLITENRTLLDRRKHAERAHAEGHWIGNHTFNALVLLGLTAEPGVAADEIRRSEALIGRLAHERRFFRPFGGEGFLDERLLNREALAYLGAGDHTCVLWNAVPADWAHPTGWVDTAGPSWRAPWSADRDEALPADASAKALEFAELVTLGAGVFCSLESATRWLTRPHPLLDGATPLDRAKTRWGFDEVKSLLVAVRYGSAA